MKKKPTYVLDVYGRRQPTDENQRDCPGCKEPNPTQNQHKDWSEAFVAIQNGLNSLEFLYVSGRPNAPSVEAVAALQDKADQILEKLWLRNDEQQKLLPLQKQETTESTTQLDVASQME